MAAETTRASMAPRKRAKSAATITAQRCVGEIVKTVYPYKEKLLNSKSSEWFRQASRIHIKNWAIWLLG
jgi:hypothetical protein